jgi:hypothetical protein
MGRKLLQTPVDDYRKFVVWCILAPYLINIRKCSADEAYNLIKNWLDKCSQLRSLDFNSNYDQIQYQFCEEEWISLDKFGKVKDRKNKFVQYSDKTLNSDELSIP